MTPHSHRRPGHRSTPRTWLGTTSAALALGGVVVGVLVVRALVVFAADAPAKPPAATGPDLGGAERYLTHVGTDKPVYRIGERVYVRAPVLRADTRAPLPANQQAQSLVEVRGPKGDVVASGYAQPQDGVVAFAWDVLEGTAGGEYTVKVSHPFTGHAKTRC